MRNAGRIACVTAAAALAGCDVDLERMIDQPRFTAYEQCEICPDGTIMMRPPPGTVSRSATLVEGPRGRGRLADGRYVDALPVAIDRDTLARGKSRFDIFCAACHSRLANGVSQVAENMSLRKPPNLLALPYAASPPGRVFAVITEGFGLMRSYASELTIDDRWAVVAYLEALELAQGVPLADLPAAIQEEARPWLK